MCHKSQKHHMWCHYIHISHLGVQCLQIAGYHSPCKAINSLLAMFTEALVWRNSPGNGDYCVIWKSFEEEPTLHPPGLSCLIMWLFLLKLPICDFSSPVSMQNISCVALDCVTSHRESSTNTAIRTASENQHYKKEQTVVLTMWAVPEVIVFPGLIIQTAAKLSCKCFVTQIQTKRTYYVMVKYKFDCFLRCALFLTITPAKLSGVMWTKCCSGFSLKVLYGCKQNLFSNIFKSSNHMCTVGNGSLMLCLF